MEPGKDVMPGGQSDFLTIKDYVQIRESGILWSSRDTAVTALGELWNGYISPAHRCVMKNEYHPPLSASSFNGGKIFAMLSANNFGTNFMCSQVFDGVYTFSFAAVGNVDDAACAGWGEREQNPVLTQFTDRSRGEEAPSASLLDTGNLHCISLHKAGEEYIARLWNHNEEEMPLSIRFLGKQIQNVHLCDAVGNPMQSNMDMIPAKNVYTIRFTVE